MLKIPQIFLLLSSIFILTACTKQATLKKPIPSKKIVKKEKVIKKIVKKKIKKTPPKYKYCNKHIKIMTHASTYISNEFEKGYFEGKDLIGAKAQVYLIENKSPNVFAQNINAALNSYNKEYNLAKKHRCNIKNFKTHPLTKIKNYIKINEEKQ